MLSLKKINKVLEKAPLKLEIKKLMRNPEKVPEDKSHISEST